MSPLCGIFVLSFLSLYESSRKEYVHLDCYFFTSHHTKPGKRGKKYFFGHFPVDAMFGGSTILPKEASLSQKVSASAWCGPCRPKPAPVLLSSLYVLP